MRQYIYAIFWGALIGALVYSGLNVVTFKNNTVRFLVAVIFGVSIFTMVGLQVERFDSSPIVLASDNGYTATGNFTTHFPSTTQIILDSRSVTVDNTQKVTAYGSTSPVPAVGSIITGPFIGSGTTLVSISNTALPSNSYVSGLLATISQPLVNMTEKRGDVFIYTFTLSPPTPAASTGSGVTGSGVTGSGVTGTGVTGSGVTGSGSTAPISTGSVSSSSTSKLGPGMNQVYISDSYLCSSLNGDLGSDDLCNLKPA